MSPLRRGIAAQLKTIMARYPGNCPACRTPIVPGEQIKKHSSGRYVHERCWTGPAPPAQVVTTPSVPNVALMIRSRPVPIARPAPIVPQSITLGADDELKQTLDEHYNALCTRLDRIMTGNPTITVHGGATSSVAETLRDVEGAESGQERAHVRFDHGIIKRWARDGYDRTALTLALNIHELGHIWHTPAKRRHYHPATVVAMMNLIEDQRQEILTSLQYPRAVDYLRFLNARALALSIMIANRPVIDEDTQRPRGPTTKEIDEKIGRQFLMHYGRRHLYPPSVNKRLWQLAVDKYGPQVVAEIESLIDEFLRLAMPSGLARGWKIAERLAQIDEAYDPYYNGVPSVGDGDPRHGCFERDGEPLLDIPAKEALKREIRRLVKRPTKTKEPIQLPQRPQPKTPEPEPGEPIEPDELGDAPAAETPEEEVAAKLGAPDDISDEDPAETERTEQGGEDETPEETEEESADEGEGENEAEKEASEDAATPPEVEGSGKGEGDDQEDTGEGGDAPSDELGAEDEDETPSAPAHGAGPSPAVDPLLKTLSALAKEALSEVADEVGDRHEAIKTSEFAPSMGGSRRGGLDSPYVDSARRLGHMFRDINQDLRATTARGQRRGRLDTRRLPTALASNSARIFKRRLPDLSTEAALAVHIMIDTSGSMYNSIADTSMGATRWNYPLASKVSVALPAGFALAKGVELAGHRAKVTTYADSEVVQKNWLDEMYRVYKDAPGGGTDPSGALIKARPDFLYLARETEIHNHVLIIITDGDFNKDCRDVCTDMLAKLVKDGVHVIEIGIGVEPEPVHGAWKILTIPDVTSLSSAMADPLRKLAIEIAKNAKRRAA